MNTSYVQDLDSTNGTFVNDQKVGQRLLKSNDIISIGMYEILFLADESTQSPTDNQASDKTQLAFSRKPAIKKSKNPFLDKS